MFYSTSEESDLVSLYNFSHRTSEQRGRTSAPGKWGVLMWDLKGQIPQILFFVFPPIWKKIVSLEKLRTKDLQRDSVWICWHCMTLKYGDKLPTGAKSERNQQKLGFVCVRNDKKPGSDSHFCHKRGFCLSWCDIHKTFLYMSNFLSCLKHFYDGDSLLSTYSSTPFTLRYNSTIKRTFYKSNNKINHYCQSLSCKDQKVSSEKSNFRKCKMGKFSVCDGSSINQTEL